MGAIGVVFCVRGDYLPSHGPVPFRFQMPPKPAVFPTPSVEKPKVVADAHPPQALPESTNSVLQWIRLETTSEVNTAKSPEPLITAPALILPTVSTLDTNETLTSQALLQFFQGRGGPSNAVDTMVSGSVTFAPPLPGPPPSSKATLIVR